MDANQAKSSKVKLVFLSLAGVFLGVVAANIFFMLASKSRPANAKNPQSQQHVKAVSSPASSPIAQPASQPQAIAKPAKTIATAAVPLAQTSSFTLNGVFYSSDEVYAIVNNQVVKVGDEISGAQVKQITLDGVELQESGQTIFLKQY